MASLWITTRNRRTACGFARFAPHAESMAPHLRPSRRSRIHGLRASGRAQPRSDGVPVCGGESPYAVDSSQTTDLR